MYEFVCVCMCKCVIDSRKALFAVCRRLKIEKRNMEQLRSSQAASLLWILHKDVVAECSTSFGPIHLEAQTQLSALHHFPVLEIKTKIVKTITSLYKNNNNKSMRRVMTFYIFADFFHVRLNRRHFENPSCGQNQGQVGQLERQFGIQKRLMTFISS